MRQINSRDIYRATIWWPYLFLCFTAFLFGMLIVYGIFSLPHVLIFAVLTTIFIIRKLNFILYFTLILMFIPLSLGNIFKIKINMAAEPLIFISFMAILFHYISSGRKSYVFSSSKNPFLVPIILYIIVLLINYIRYPLPPSSLSGISEELGGIRFYYDKIIMFIFFMSIAYRSEVDVSFIKKVFGIVVLMTSIANIIGILLYVYPNFDNIFTSLYNNRIFSNSFFNGSLGRSIDPLTDAVRINVFWGTAIGFFILISNVIKPKHIIKIILLSLYAVGILLSATRSFFFGIIIALIIWAFLSKNKKLMYIFIVVALLGLIVQTVSSFSPQINRLFYFPSDIDKLTTSRIDLFNIYWNDFRKNMLFGVGVGATEIPKAASAQVYFFLINLRFGGHGFFLGSLYTMGIIGLLPFLMLYYKAIRVSYKLYKRPSAEFDKLTGMLCIMFIGYSLIPFIVGGIETYNQFFLLIGIIAGLYMKLQRDNATI